MASTREKLLATTFKFAAAFNDWDVDEILALRSENCLLHPCCPSFTARPFNKEETRTASLEWASLTSHHRFRIIDKSNILVDEAAKKVMLRGRVTADTVVGPYENDYIYILRMTEDCTLVDEIWYFYDTLRIQELLDRLAANQMPLGGVGGFVALPDGTSAEHDKGSSDNIEPKSAA
ncbi:hypothetical protein BDW59DRAFT_161050 [Aspergillus cavernicola]|uniref:SnoaL-like domain-containing protein n=1 Tax=Aspergillus cavernicola TaxID=176166 RepID=A0ABR4IER3_9EURO